MTTTRIEIAARLRTAREAAGLSQAQVARMLEVARPTVSEIEAGRRRVPAEELARLADIYAVSADWVLFGASAVDNNRLLAAAREADRIDPKDLDRIREIIGMLRPGESDGSS